MPIYSLDGVSPRLPENGDYWIAPDAVVVGDVVIEPGVSIWFGCVLRGDNERIHIGANTNIQENCILHTDMGFPLTIGADCTVGHGVTLHGCIIGSQTLIGMGTTVLNGAEIGDRCLVGAHALVTEGKHFENESLIVGMPAQVKRHLDEKAIAGLKKSADSYVRNGRRYHTGLKPV